MVKKLLLTTTAFALSSAVNAQDRNDNRSEVDNDEDVIIVTGQLSDFGALKSATPIVETARSVTIETEEQFRDKGALTLDDVLNYIPGVVGDTFGFATRGDLPQVRGFDAAEYRDGQQVLFGFYNNTRSDVYMLEQVEVLKGPASVLYGKGTPGGIVNAVSKLAGPDKQSEVIFDVGTFDRYQAAADLNAEVANNLFVRFVGVYRDSDTQINSVNDDAIIAMPSITYDDGQTRVTAMLEYVDRDSDTAQQFLPLTGTGCVSGNVVITPAAVCVNSSGESVELDTYLGDPSFNRYDTNSTLVSLLASHAFTENFSIDGIFRYKDSDVDYRQSYIDFLGAVGPPRVDANGDGGRTFYRSNAFSKQAAFDLRARWTFKTGPIEHELFGGVAYQNVKTGNEVIFLSDPVTRAFGTINIFNPVYGNVPPPLFDDANFFDVGDTITDDYGLYLNNQMSIGDLKLNFGLRYDDSKTESGTNVQKDDAVSFSVGALYAFDGGISPYVSFAESFEPVIGTDGLTTNPLKPREGKQWEVGVKYQPPGTQTYITFAYFDIEESNLANPSSLINQPNSQQEGVGTVKGFEIQGQTTLGDWYLELNGSLLDTETADGVPFASIPEEQASAWVQYQPVAGALEGFKAGFGLRYVGDNESNGTGAVGPIRVVTDGNVLGDLLLGYETERWDVTFNVRNITNEKYFSTCLARGDCFVGEERTAVVRVGYKF